MNGGIVRVTAKQVAELLGFGDDVDIIDARVDFNSRCVELFLTGPTMPKMGEGMPALVIQHPEDRL